MADIKEPVPTAAKQVRTDALSTAAFILPSPEPERWDFGWHRKVLALEDRVIAAPIPDRPEAKKFERIARHWADTHTRIFEADPKLAYDIVCQAITKHVNRNTGTVCVKFAFLENDRFDPGRVLHDALHRTWALLWRGGALDWPGEAEAIRTIGQTLIDFHDARSTANDVRFAPIRTLGNCLLRLAVHVRALA